MNHKADNHLSQLASEIYAYIVCDQEMEEDIMYRGEIPQSHWQAIHKEYREGLTKIYDKYDIDEKEFIRRMKERGLDGNHIYRIFRGEV